MIHRRGLARSVRFLAPLVAISLGAAAAAWACTAQSRIELSSSSGHAGSSVAVIGRDFNQLPVEIRWDTIDGPLLATVPDGRQFRVDVKIPDSASADVHLIVAVQNPPPGSTVPPGRASQPFTVSASGSNQNAEPQPAPGYQPDPGRQPIPEGNQAEYAPPPPAASASTSERNAPVAAPQQSAPGPNTSATQKIVAAPSDGAPQAVSASQDDPLTPVPGAAAAPGPPVPLEETAQSSGLGDTSGLWAGDAAKAQDPSKARPLWLDESPIAVKTAAGSLAGLVVLLLAWRMFRVLGRPVSP